MSANLFALRDHEPPMGDLGAQPTLGFTRSLWTSPLAGEETAPDRRIIHAKALQLHAPTPLHRLGLRRAPGYHKCGSQQALDWVTAFRMRVWTEDGWTAYRHEKSLSPPAPDTLQWFDLGDVRTSAVILEVRRCGIDDWWTPWNLAEEAFVLEGEPARPAPRNESTLDKETISISDRPAGLEAEIRDGAVRFRSARLDVGFSLNRTGFSHLCVDEPGDGDFRSNLLHREPGTFHQGLQLHPVGAAPVAAPSLRYNVEGTTRVAGNRVLYTVRLGDSGLRYRLEWTVQPDRLTLHAEREGDHSLRAWHSSAWLTGLRSTVSPAHVLGRLRRTGETGWVNLPAWLHAPGFGSLRLQSSGDAVSLRTNVYRAQDLLTAEVKLGERPQPEGDYLLPAGRHETTLEWVVDTPDRSLQEAAPDAVADAVDRCRLTALTYRPDTATLSNNGASIHCPHSMDTWAATTTRLGEVLPDTDASYFLRTSLERWLDGGPGYASGPLLKNDGDLHDAEDEYLMTGAAGLLGLALFLQRRGTAEWVDRYRRPIQRRLEKVRARDLDDDGLIESPYRTGVSGTGQWSTNWLDVISFGWKDAFANALLYPALTRLAETLPVLGASSLAAGLDEWADQLRARYQPTFFNPETGWLAGWRCKNDELHDHAFLPVNGAAVSGGLLDADTARTVMERLWAEAQRVDFPDPVLGLPCNLWSIPDEDRADILQGYPFGYYQNGGRTHAQCHHFVRALYRVGLTDAADHLLERLCRGLAEGRTYGGSKSGIDWRHWDDRPCGYEGLLTEQFGVLAVALERYGATQAGQSAQPDAGPVPPEER
ncbi:MAG: hypothetical protein ABEL51_03975 [Salinibacter sp.]